MTHISIRDLQKMSSETISSLRGPTPVRSGNRTVAILIPLKPPDPERMLKALKRAEELAKGRDPAADDAALAGLGIDPTDWSVEAVRELQREHLKSRKK